MNKHPRWATHIIKWPHDEERLYVGKNLYQFIDSEFPLLGTEDGEVFKTETETLSLFLRCGWKIDKKLNMPMENK